MPQAHRGTQVWYSLQAPTSCGGGGWRPHCSGSLSLHPESPQERNPGVPTSLSPVPCKTLSPTSRCHPTSRPPSCPLANAPLPVPAMSGLPGSPSLLPDVGAVGVTPDKRYRKRLVNGGPWGPRMGGRGRAVPLAPLARSLPAGPPGCHAPPRRGPLPLPAVTPAPQPSETPHLAVVHPLCGEAGGPG